MTGKGSARLPPDENSTERTEQAVRLNLANELLDSVQVIEMTMTQIFHKIHTTAAPLPFRAASPYGGSLTFTRGLMKFIAAILLVIMVNIAPISPRHCDPGLEPGEPIRDP